jgi:hypothetical protein
MYILIKYLKIRFYSDEMHRIVLGTGTHQEYADTSGIWKIMLCHHEYAYDAIQSVSVAKKLQDIDST